MRLRQILAKDKILLIIIILLGLALRLIKLDQSFWLDEASQALSSSQSLQAIWSGRGGDFHPPLFYVIAHFWLRFGRSETWLRLLPVLFGVLNIYVVYIFARKLFSGRGHISAFLLSIAPYHIYYSQEFRSYSLLCLLGTLAMYFLHQKRYFLLTLTNSALLYTHYSSVFLLMAQLGYTFFYDRKNLKLFLGYWSLVIILYLPWIPQFVSQLRAGANIDEYLPGWRKVLSISPLKAIPVTLFKLIAGRISFLSRWLYGVYILFVFGVSFAAFILSRHPAKAFLSFWALVPILTMLATSLALPQNQPFRIIYVLPAFILLLTAASLRFPKLFLTFFIYISLVGNVAYYTRPRLQREQWRQALSFLQSSGDPVIIKFSDKFAPISWYTPSLNVIPAVPVFPARAKDVSSKLASLSSPSVFLLEYLTDLTDPDRLTDRTLTELGYNLTHTYDYPGVGFIYEFKKP